MMSTREYPDEELGPAVIDVLRNADASDDAIQTIRDSVDTQMCLTRCEQAARSANTLDKLRLAVSNLVELADSIHHLTFGANPKELLATFFTNLADDLLEQKPDLSANGGSGGSIWTNCDIKVEPCSQDGAKLNNAGLDERVPQHGTRLYVSGIPSTAVDHDLCNFSRPYTL